MHFHAIPLALGLGIGFCTLTPAAAEPFQHRKNVVYGEAYGVGLIMDIFKPTGKKNGLGVVQVVSGAWSSDRGKIEDLARAQVFEIFCGRGYTVFAIRPGSISKFTASDMTKNIERGVRWVKQHAGEHEVDANRLGLMGASAGGHIASLVAVANGRSTGEQDASIAAAGIFFPPTDFLDYGGRRLDPRGENRISSLIRRLAFSEDVDELNDEDVEERLVSISPARRVTANAPPFLLIHGDADFMVPLQQSRALKTALEAKQIPVRLIVVPGGGHPWPTIHKEVAQMADWFDQQLESTPHGKAAVSD